MIKKTLGVAIFVITLSIQVGAQNANATPTCESEQLRRLVTRIGLAERRISKIETRTQRAVQAIQKRGRYGVQSAQQQIRTLSGQYGRELAACEEGIQRACLSAESTRKLIEGLQNMKESQIPSGVNRATKLYWKQYRHVVRPLRRKIHRAERFIRGCLQ
jgi:hypothetical protein